MRRICAILLASIFAMGGGMANAETQTVDGNGDITKMVASNGTNAVTAKVFGLARPCGGAQYLHVSLTNRNGRLLYMAEGSCIQAQWFTGLYYTATGVPEDLRKVRCPNFSFTRSRTTGAYRIEMPRGCLDNAPNRVKVKAEGANYGSMTGGAAGPTKLLARG